MADISSAGRVVVGVDGSPGSRWALAWAARAARQEGAPLDVVAVWDYTTSWGRTPGHTDFSARRDRQEAVFAAVDDVLWGVRPEALRVILRHGPAAPALVDKSKDALLLVVGTTGRRGLRGALHRSVSDYVATHATCPVLVVRAPSVPDAFVGEPVGEADLRC
jgi:nucleotide-binding universal stress UspA family protein